MSKLDQKYLLLIRHGSVKRIVEIKDEDQGLDSNGIDVAYETASMLGDQLMVERINHVKIWCSKYKHAIQHAGIVKKMLEKYGLTVDTIEMDELSPSSFRYWNKKEMKSFVNEIKNNLKIIKEKEVLLLVGHQPQLGWICDLFHKAIPIARSEIVCLDFCKRFIWNFRGANKIHLKWSIAPSDSDTMIQLRDKIKSKMDTAKVLGTFIVFLLGIVLGILSDKGKLDLLIASEESVRNICGELSNIELECLNKFYAIIIKISVISLFLSAVFYLLSMFAYDRLLMPTRFWAEGIKKRAPKWIPLRPPSSSLLILQVNMMRVWRLLFTPATFLVLLSLIGFSFVVMRADPLEYLIVIMVLSVGVYLYYNYAKPHLGAED